jgi:hypothetical protein
VRHNDLGNTVYQWPEVTEIHALSETELVLAPFDYSHLMKSSFKEENIENK